MIINLTIIMIIGIVITIINIITITIIIITIIIIIIIINMSTTIGTIAAERNLNNCLEIGASECTSGLESQGLFIFIFIIGVIVNQSIFSIIIITFLTKIMVRSSNDIWSWLPNLPNSGRLPRAEADLLEVKIFKIKIIKMTIEIKIIAM